MSPPTPITSDDFKSQVLESPKPALVEFGAPWCGPCKMLEPVLKDLSETYAGQVDFFTVDVDQNPELVMEYGVMSVPTMILFRNGEPVHQVMGFKPKNVLEEAFFADLPE